MTERAIHVFLIDDNADYAYLLQKKLSQSELGRFRVELADTLGGGLDRLKEGGIDVVLLDLNLPDSKGIETVEMVFAQEPTVPVVVLSATDDEELSMESARLGAQDFLVKGQVGSDLFPRIIRYAIERKRLELELEEANQKLDAFRHEVHAAS